MHAGSDGLRKKPNRIGLLNRAVLWHLQISLRLLDRLGYQMTAINVASAIDALTSEAASDEEISKMDLNRGDQARLILEIYEKHGLSGSVDVKSMDKGPFHDGHVEET